MRTGLRTLTLLAAAIVASIALAACGGDDSDVDGGTAVSADTDAQAVLDTALGAEGEPIESGVLDLSIDLQSGAADAVSGNATVAGPFDSSGEDALPSVDFDVQATLDSAESDLGFEGALTLTSDGLYVGYGGTDYVLDDATFALIEDSYAQSAELQEEQEGEGSLSQFGIDPATWLGEVTNDGEEDLEGTTVVHVSGTADVAKIIDDLGTVAEQTGQAPQLDASALGQLEDSVQDASIDVFANADDGSLRQLDVGLVLANPDGGGATDELALSVGIAEPNEEQEVTAPEDAQPIADLLGQLPGGISSLGGLGATDPSAVPDGGAGSDAYYECVATAATPKALSECSELLGAG